MRSADAPPSRLPEGRAGQAVDPPDLLVRLSPGDVLDRLTILTLKLEASPEGPAAAALQRAWTGLAESWRATLGEEPSHAAEWGELLQVNRALWALEDTVRRHESRLDFGPEFVAAARAIYTTNDRRAALKGQVDTRLCSRLSDIKLHG